jgi:hypothetical protein
LVVSLVLLSFLLLLGAALTRSVVLHRMQAKYSERREQAALLADSALRRAVRALTTSEEYRGETWQIPAEAFGDEAGGVAVIQVENAAESGRHRHITVKATYPDQGTPHFAFRRELTMELPAPGPNAADPTADASR